MSTASRIDIRKEVKYKLFPLWYASGTRCPLLHVPLSWTQTPISYTQTRPTFLYSINAAIYQSHVCRHCYTSHFPYSDAVISQSVVRRYVPLCCIRLMLLYAKLMYADPPTLPCTHPLLYPKVLYTDTAHTCITLLCAGMNKMLHIPKCCGLPLRPGAMIPGVLGACAK